MNDRLPTELVISAQRRIAANAGITIMVVQKGDPFSGAILLKVNTLDGKASVYSQIRIEDDLYWSPAPKAHNAPERDVDLYLQKQADFDPDLWIVEVEDKEGRLWFPGRIMENEPDAFGSSAFSKDRL